MKRRKFFKISAAASAAVMMNGLPVRSLAGNQALRALARQTESSGRVLVLIQLIGGNDGLNTIIPLDQYSNLSAARSNILIPETSVLSINGRKDVGFHPAIEGLRNMYNDGMVNIVQSAGYDNPSFSHFRSTDIWNEGASATEYLNTGWLGRYLAQRYSGFPTGYPNNDMPDPLAIQVGSGVSPVFQGTDVSMGMAISDINSFYNLISSTVDPAPATPAGHELTFLRYIAQQTQSYNNSLQTAASNANNLSSLYTTGNSLSDQLKIVARLIAGGLMTPVYLVSMSGFDNHSAQTDDTDHTIGAHATLLKKLSDAVTAFFDDCKRLKIDDRVVAMTYSEFGRRIKSNASGGTDHGTAAPVMVFGNAVNPIIIGNNPTIGQQVSVDDNIDMQYDYRSIYSSVLTDWFQLDSASVNDVLLNTYSVLPIFRDGSATEVPTVGGAAAGQEVLGQNYPNPFSRSTTISFSSKGGTTVIQLFDASGRAVKTLTQQQYGNGQFSITIDRDNLPAGNYFYRLINSEGQWSKQLAIVD